MFRTKKLKNFISLATLVLSLMPFSVLAQTAEESQNFGSFVPRGLAIHELVQTFALREKNADFIGKCMENLNDCFFTFAAMTRFNGMQLEPLRLYPDVSEAYSYAGDIHLATMLGLVHGNIEIKGSPFYPRAYMTRIQALKVVLGAAELMDWREKFELVRDLGNEDDLRYQKTPFSDVTGLREDSWWYPRYVNFAVDFGLVDRPVDAGPSETKTFHPDEPITEREYNDMLARTLKRSLKKSSALSVQNANTSPKN